MTERQVPGPAPDNNERIASRPYDDFARFPDEEVQRIDRPGAGPQGTVDAGPRMPRVVIFVGLVLLFVTFVVRNPVPLVLGLLLIVGGGIWAGASGPMTGSGTGPTTIDESR